MRMNLATVMHVNGNSTMKEKELYFSLTKKFAESYGMRHQDTVVTVGSDVSILPEFVRWMREDCGFTTVRPWKLLPKYDKPNYGFDMDDKDPGFIQWKLVNMP